MKSYSTITEFIIGLLGVIIHSFVVIFIVSYLANPSQLDFYLESATGIEQQMLQQFVDDVHNFSYMAYFGSAIVLFEWIAVFRIRKHANTRTPIWASFLILGALYAYFYFGGLEATLLLFISGVLTLVRYYQHRNIKTS